MTGFVFCNRFGNVHNPQTINRTIRRISENYNAEEVYAEAAVLVDLAIEEAGDVDTAVITPKMEKYAKEMKRGTPSGENCRNKGIDLLENRDKAIYFLAYMKIYKYFLAKETIKP